jgi:nitrite reductase/ring-hydroxylating ferredoxin subunit
MDIKKPYIYMKKILEHNDLKPGSKRIVVLPNGEEIALFHTGSEILAIKNECPHEGGPLGEGELEGFCVSCPWHGWQFDVRSGECLNVPGESVEKVQLEILEDGIYLKEI